MKPEVLPAEGGRALKLLVVGLFLLAGGPAAAQSPNTAEYFEKHVRPLLAEQCTKCHNGTMRTAGVDLSNAAGVAAIVSSSRPGESRLLQVVGFDQRIKMPPTGKLPPEAIAKIEAWVKAGAVLPDSRSGPFSKSAPTGVLSLARTSHWAFQPVRDHAPPVVKAGAWVQSPLDRFILAKLEEKALPAPPRAGKLTLIRRAKYDLLGLPPTESEVRDFLADQSPHAFAKVVDRFLASPQYGEKWGRHWLDVARYAESCGVDDNDAYTDAWRYREYVIDAFNRDVPFDRMIREQIAGDLLPSEDGSGINVRGRVATGFLALGPKATVEMDKMKTAYDVIDEQIDTTTKAFLGLTVACARCHDHKFDPIATRDYYSLAAIFANTKTFDNQKGDFFTERKSRLYMAPLVADAVYEDYRVQQQKIAAKNMQATALLDNEVWRIESGTLFPRLADYMVAAWKVQHANSVATDIAASEKLDARILDAWIKYLDPQGGFLPHLQRWRAASEANVAAVAREYAALFQKTAVNWGELLVQWKVAVAVAVRSNRELPKAPNIEYNSTTAFTDPSERFFADIVIPARTLNDRTAKDGPFVLPAAEQEALLAAPAKERLVALRAESAELTKQAAARPPMANAVGEGPRVEQHVLLRGSYSSPGELVQPGMPVVLRGDVKLSPIEQGSGRRELAEFLASPTNPLTARVMVNRLWQWHFGEGLVRTPNNFGLAGEAPTHPELLDYLASRFVENGWSIKSMHRMLMLSSLYQSDSKVSPEAGRIDPANRLWSRFQRRRLTVEEMRDTWLILSGSLELKMGGIFDQVDAEAGGGRGGRGMRGAANPRSFDVSKRRTIYVAVNRTAIPTPMVLYDFVDSTTSASERPETTIAPQALYLMNNPFAAKNASDFAARLLADKEASDEQRVRKAYSLAWQREPDATELAGALKYIASYPVAEKQGFGGWQSFCRILLSANQFHYVD